MSKNNDALRVSELGALTQLCGTLSVVNLENVGDATEASNAKLEEMKSLEELKLKWFKWKCSLPDLNKEKAILDNLRPHKFLKKLKIKRYCGHGFPQ